MEDAGTLLRRLTASLGDRRAPVAAPAGARRAAVLVPVVGAREPALLLCERTHDVLEHKGEICFPGGSLEPHDRDAVAAALREAHEELGVSASDVEIVGLLGDVQTTSSNFVVTPVVGFLQRLPRLRPNRLEVSRWLLVSLAALQARGVERSFYCAAAGCSRVHYEYVVPGARIWGATARIVRSLLARPAAVEGVTR